MNKVVMCGPFSSRSGYGDHARSIFASLVTIEDFDILILDVRWGDTPQDALENDGKIETQIKKRLTNPSELSFQPDIYIDIRIPNEFITPGKINVGITAGIETNIVSPAFLQGANQMDLLIVPSEHAKTGFMETTYEMEQNGQPTQQSLQCTVPIEVVHEGLDPNIFRKLSKKEIDKKFANKISNIVKRPSALFVGQWTQGGFGNDRKDIARLVKLYIETFGNKPNPPGLLMKTNGATYSQLDYHEVKKKIAAIKEQFPPGIKVPPIYLLHANLTEEEMNQLYNHDKIFGLITLTHGEGFGRPMLEATFAELPVCATKWSGQLDFLPEDKCCLIEGEMTQVPDDVVWENIIVKESSWFTASEMSAYERFRSFYNENHTKWKRLGKEVSEQNRKDFSLDAMTDKLVNIFSDLKNKIPKPMQIKLPKLETI